MSYKKNGEIHIEQVDAKGGTREGKVRWILGVSLVAAIVLMSGIWMFGAASQGDVESEINTTAIAEERSSNNADDIGVAVATEVEQEPAVGTE